MPVPRIHCTPCRKVSTAVRVSSSLIFMRLVTKLGKKSRLFFATAFVQTASAVASRRPRCRVYRKLVSSKKGLLCVWSWEEQGCKCRTLPARCGANFRLWLNNKNNKVTCRLRGPTWLAGIKWRGHKYDMRTHGLTYSDHRLAQKVGFESL